MAQVPAGVILCGGQASRFGGDKARAALAGASLLQHVARRVAPQVSELFLSAQADTPLPDELDARLVPDAVQRHRGPLAGLYSALEYLQGEATADWLLLCPCDAPFVPRDLAARLAASVTGKDCLVAAARYDGVVQPTFSLWSLETLPAVRRTVLDQGAGGLMRMLDGLQHACVDWPAAEPPPFFNVNTPADLAEAERLLDAAGASGRH
ncbi:MAG: molybdenum cofactor guanylyltransferase [Xanthomonadales bacterium]|nr:molybdenum cofactor guanylyltransferase [Xanthomonadales bacterium]